jgi:hypothetical protein
MFGAVERVDRVLAELRVDHTPRNRAFALEPAFVVEQRGRLGTMYADRASPEHARAEQVAVERAAALPNKVVAVVQDRATGVERSIAWNA